MMFLCCPAKVSSGWFPFQFPNVKVSGWEISILALKTCALFAVCLGLTLERYDPSKVGWVRPVSPAKNLCRVLQAYNGPKLSLKQRVGAVIEIKPALGLKPLQVEFQVVILKKTIFETAKNSNQTAINSNQTAIIFLMQFSQLFMTTYFSEMAWLGAGGLHTWMFLWVYPQPAMGNMEKKRLSTWNQSYPLQSHQYNKSSFSKK